MDVVLTSFFVGQPDPQRVEPLKPDVTLLDTLAGSVPMNELVVLHNCFDLPELPTWERIEAPEIAYRQRWLSQWQWLRRHPEVRYAWLVDATDTEMLRPPWNAMKPGLLYTGWENEVVGCEWIRRHSKRVSLWVRKHARDQLLNCGVVGGDRRTVMELCMRMNDMWATTGADALHEMIFFNIAARAMTHEATLVTGPTITTEFKQYKDNGQAFWRHK